MFGAYKTQTELMSMNCVWTGLVASIYMYLIYLILHHIGIQIHVLVNLCCSINSTRFDQHCWPSDSWKFRVFNIARVQYLMSMNCGLIGPVACLHEYVPTYLILHPIGIQIHALVNLCCYVNSAWFDQTLLPFWRLQV